MHMLMLLFGRSICTKTLSLKKGIHFEVNRLKFRLKIDFFFFNYSETLIPVLFSFPRKLAKHRVFFVYYFFIKIQFFNSRNFPIQNICSYPPINGNFLTVIDGYCRKIKAQVLAPINFDENSVI